MIVRIVLFAAGRHRLNGADPELRARYRSGKSYRRGRLGGGRMNLGLVLRKRVGERCHQDRSFRRGVPDDFDGRTQLEPIADDQRGGEKAKRDQQHSQNGRRNE